MTLSATLPTSTPEAQGIGSEAILAFLDAVEAADGLDLHSLMLLRHGAVVAEGYWAPYDAETPHMLFSLSKSFTSTAIGLLVAEGKLTIEDEVLPFFPNKAPAAPDANLRALRVKHLLTMTTGHDVDPTRAVRGSSEWIRGFFAEPLLHEPGTHFVYNSLATYLLSAIAQRLAGQRILEYLRPRLFEPLGIENPTWEQSPEGIDVGGWGLSIRTRDIARFGQLYLQRGTWEGRQLVPLAWVDEATGRRVPNSSPNPDWEQGYGYQFWRCRYGAYRGDGAFGQFCVVLPAQDAVLAITSGVTSMQAVLDLVWTHLLPAFGPAPLAQDGGARLADRLGGLKLAPPEGSASSPIAARVSGRPYRIAPNDDGVESVAFDLGGAERALVIHDRHGEHRVVLGHGEWRRGDSGLGDRAPWRVAASGAWRDDSTFVAKIWWHETPWAQTYACTFDGDTVRIERKTNVGFPGQPTEVTFEGIAA